MLIRIRNWKDYAPKDASRLKNPWWFKWDNAVLLSTKYLRLGQREITALAYLRSLASEENNPKGEVWIEDNHLLVFGRMSKEDFRQALKKLSDVELVDVKEPDVRKDFAEISPEDRGEIAHRIEERRIEESNTTSSIDSEPTLPLPELEAKPANDSRVYDHHHESVVTKAKSTELPRLAQIWNEHRSPELGAVILAAGKRKTSALARMREHPGEQFWIDAVKRISVSDFCLGRVTPKDGGRPWKANFDWFVRPDTIAKILEGQYDNRRSGPGSSPSTLSYWARQQAEQKEPQQ